MKQTINNVIYKVAGKGIPVSITYLHEYAYHTIKGTMINSEIDCVIMQSLKSNATKSINRQSIKVIDIIKG